MKQPINEIKRMQQLAGILNENEENFSLLSWATSNKEKLQQILNTKAEEHDIEPIEIGIIESGDNIFGDEGEYSYSVFLQDEGSEGEVGVLIWEADKESNSSIYLGDFETTGDEGEFELDGLNLKYGWVYS